MSVSVRVCVYFTTDTREKKRRGGGGKQKSGEEVGLFYLTSFSRAWTFQGNHARTVTPREAGEGSRDVEQLDREWRTKTSKMKARIR